MTTKDKFLRELVRNYKQANPKRVIGLDGLARATGSDYQELEDIAAELRSEGSIITRGFHTYQLTDSGYAKYRARVEAIGILA